MEVICWDFLYLPSISSMKMKDLQFCATKGMRIFSRFEFISSVLWRKTFFIFSPSSLSPDLKWEAMNYLNPPTFIRQSIHSEIFLMFYYFLLNYSILMASSSILPNFLTPIPCTMFFELPMNAFSFSKTEIPEKSNLMLTVVSSLIILEIFNGLIVSSLPL